jgi:hypothetical protein
MLGWVSFASARTLSDCHPFILLLHKRPRTITKTAADRCCHNTLQNDYNALHGEHAPMLSNKQDSCSAQKFAI